MNGDGEVEVDDLEGGVEDITLKVADVILTDDEVYHPCLLVFFVDYAFVLLQLEGLLATELDQNGLAALTDKLINNMPIQVPIVEREKQRARDGAPQPLNINLRHFLDLESYIARQVVESPIVLLLLEDLIRRELCLLFIPFLHLNQCGLHSIMLLLFHFKTNLIICAIK